MLFCRVRTTCLKEGSYFSPILSPKFNIFILYTILAHKNQCQWSLYEVSNTKSPLRLILLLRCKQNSLGKIRKIMILIEIDRIVWLLSQWPNIPQWPFCIQNKREAILHHLLTRPMLLHFQELSYKKLKLSSCQVVKMLSCQVAKLPSWLLLYLCYKDSMPSLFQQWEAFNHKTYLAK